MSCIAETVIVLPKGLRFLKIVHQVNSLTFSPQATYIDQATATGLRILMPTFANRGVSRGQHSGPAPPLITVF
jgi:hypothetical protein